MQKDHIVVYCIDPVNREVMSCVVYEEGPQYAALRDSTNM